MADIEQIRQQTAEARRIVEEKKVQVAQLQNQLSEQEQALPTTSTQRDLRERFAGQQGIVQRRQFENIRADIEQRKANVNEYGQQLGKYEKQVAESEGNIAAYERAFKKYSEQKRDAKLYNQELNKAVNDYNAGVPLDEAFKKFNVDYLVNKGVLKFESAGNQIEVTEAKNKFNELLNQQPNLPFIRDRTTNVQIQTRMPKTITGIGLVSAQEYNPKTGAPYGIESSVKKPVDIVEKAKVWLAERKKSEKSSSMLAGAGASLLGTATALAHPAKTINAIPAGIKSVSTRVLTNKNFPELSHKIANPKPYDVGYIGAEIATTKGTGVLAKGATKALYKAYDLPKVKTTFLTQEVGQSGSDTFLKSAALSDVKGLFRNKKVLSAAYTQVRQGKPIGELQQFKAATIGVQRTKNLRGWSKPKGFGAGEVGLTRQVNVMGDVGTLNGARITREVPINQFQSLGFVKASRKAKQTYHATTGATRNFGEMDAVWALTKPVKRTSKGLRFSPGSNKVFGLVTKPKEKLSVFGGNVQAYGKGAGSTAAVVQKSAINTAIKAQFINKAANTGKTAGTSFAAILGLKPKAQSSLKYSTGTTSRQEVQPRTMQSMWYGTGQYEKTSETIAAIPKQRVEQRMQNKQVSGLNYALGLSQSPQGRLGLKSGQKYQQQYRQQQKQQTKQSYVDWFGNRTIHAARSAFRPVTSYSTKGGKVVKTEPGRYLILVKRFGTDSVVGEATTLEEAKRILANNLQTTLAASGYVAEKSTRRKVKVSDMFGGMFTPAKKDYYRVVQRRGKRLSAQSEVNEIWGFKKRKLKSPKSRRISWW